ncbi:MAG: DUF805 domain-containing protein [Devosiaceae bacterium]|nr:DUF805 domain-containing protein [Devosiaceae bacterium]
MGKFLQRFIGHGGRISRRTMWQGLGALIAVAIFIHLILALIYGFDTGNSRMPLTSISEAGETIKFMAPQNDWRQLFVLVVLAYPLSALWFKRSHDINRSGILVTIFLMVAALSYIVDMSGLGYMAPQVGMMQMVERTWLSTLIQVAYGIFAVYLLVTLGFFAGTKGSNLYGSDPQGE